MAGRWYFYLLYLLVAQMFMSWLGDTTRAVSLPQDAHP